MSLHDAVDVDVACTGCGRLVRVWDWADADGVLCDDCDNEDNNDENR